MTGRNIAQKSFSFFFFLIISSESIDKIDLIYCINRQYFFVLLKKPAKRVVQHCFLRNQFICAGVREIFMYFHFY